VRSGDPGAAERWAAELAAWRIPDEILAAAPESPYGFPPELFRAHPDPVETVSRERALSALPASGGWVLDVGCGGGRASLALVPPAVHLTGVDESPDMLAEFARAADERGVEHREVRGSWPSVAPDAGQADVVVSHHVLYNVPNLVPFAVALSAAARRRVVIEITDTHPWVPTNALWRQFHQLDRPAGPTADLALSVLVSAGLPARTERWAGAAIEADRDHIVAMVRRRLCLPVEREAEVAAALPVDFQMPARSMATIWWDVPSG
jgi:SAM-dependent methyltransferase